MFVTMGFSLYTVDMARHSYIWGSFPPCAKTLVISKQNQSRIYNIIAKYSYTDRPWHQDWTINLNIHTCRLIITALDASIHASLELYIMLHCKNYIVNTPNLLY